MQQQLIEFGSVITFIILLCATIILMLLEILEYSIFTEELADCF
jgi:hypothetical protein